VAQHIVRHARRPRGRTGLSRRKCTTVWPPGSEKMRFWSQILLC